MAYREAVEQAKTHFEKLLTEELFRVERMKSSEDWIDYENLKPIRIGIVDGDGIGPIITKQAKRVLELLLQEEIQDEKVKLEFIEGLTIENRSKLGQSIPDDVLVKLKNCHAILKGPSTTPAKGDPWPNLESANVSLRRELDLFANIRPVNVPDQGIDWIFFRENTEGSYILGSKGINVTADLAVDFTVTTTQGSDRIIRLAFDYAKKNNINKVSVVTKANIIKTTDGKFFSIAEQIAKEYPEVKWDHWFIDIMAANLVNPKVRTEFRVVVLPNLYGDIITDEAAQFQGGIGTAGSANVGKQYAMFEAIHGSAPRMVKEGLADFADPSGILRATIMLLRQITLVGKAKKLEMALDVCGLYEKKLVVTGYRDGATCADFADYVIQTIQDPNLASKWQSYQKPIK